MSSFESLTNEIFIASDHAGYDLKQKIVEMLKNKGIQVTDLGCESIESVDYPTYAADLSLAIKDKAKKSPHLPIGILVCGTGTGMAITANRFSWIRASVFEDNLDVIKMARSKNHINVLCMGAHIIDESKLDQAISIFLSEKTSGDRHHRRVDLMSSTLDC